MPARLRSLDHKQIRHPVIFSVPEFQDHACGTGAGHDRGKLYSAFACQSWQFRRKPRSGNDKIRPGICRSLYIVLIMPQRHHDIKTDHALWRNFPRLLILLFDRAQVCRHGISVKIRLPVTDLGGGNNADTALLRHSPCQIPETDTDPHSTLYDRFFYC